MIAVLDGKNAGEERRKIAERTTRGRTAKAHDQQVVGNGIFPYGYRKTGQGRTAGIEINAVEARIVRLIFEWYVLGDGQTGPVSFNAIALRLTTRQIETPGASRVHRKIRTCLPYAWDYGTVSYILKNPIYIGQWRWAGAVVPVPPIVSQALWDEAQIEDIKINPWDIAAGCLLVTEAGGQVTMPDGLPLDLFARKIVASNGFIQNEMIEVLADSQPWPVI